MRTPQSHPRDVRVLTFRFGMVVVGLAATVQAARADVTLFIGENTTSAPNPTIGVAWGLTSKMVGFEIEYSGTKGEGSVVRPSSGTIVGNLVVPIPLHAGRAEIYAIGGIGVYGEMYANGGGSGEVEATDWGVGARIPLFGPMKLRIDYRLFLLGDAPDASAPLKSSHPQRLSAGLSFGF